MLVARHRERVVHRSLGARFQRPTTASGSDGRARTTPSTRFSALTEITPATCASCELAFSFPTGVERGHEAAPHRRRRHDVHRRRRFRTRLRARPDASPGAPLKWKYDPKPEPAAQGVACCDVVNRGAAYADGRIFFNTLDDQTIARRRRRPARELWRTKLGDINRGETMTMAPLVVKGKVLVGNSGGEFGVRGWLTALDAATGSDRVARVQHRPGQGRADRPDFKPFYAQDRGKDLGVDDLAGRRVEDRRRHGLGLDLVRPGARPHLLRHRQSRARGTPSSGPATTSGPSAMFARDPTPARRVWFYQISPHDLHDYDGVNENVLRRPADRTGSAAQGAAAPRPQRLRVRASTARPARCCRPTPFVHITTSHRRRPEDRARCATTRRRSRSVGQGRARHLPGVAGRQGLAAVGVLAAHAAALHPAPEPLPGRRGARGQLHRRHAVRRRRREDVRRARAAHRGEFTAWDPVARRKALGDQGELPGVERRARDRRRRRLLRHDGRLVQGGRRAHAASSCGSSRPSSGIIGQPVTTAGRTASSTSPCCRASAAGPARSSSASLDPRDGTAALGFVNAMKDLPQRTTQGRHALRLRAAVSVA